MLAYAGLLEPTRSASGLLKTAFNAENLMCKLSPLRWLKRFHRKSLLKCALQPKIVKKFTKTPILGDQGHSRSMMLINLKSLSPVLVMVSSMSVPICNRFHTIQANSGKITSF